jgi:catechol-2,3-dioxygenase
MSTARLVFDHVHLVSAHPEAAARWYADVLGGEILRSANVLGAAQIHIALGGSW